MKKVQQDKEIYTYSYLHDAAKENMKLFRGKARYIPNALMEAMLLSALTIEAYLNHPGSHLLDNWADIERSLNPKDKLKKILEAISYSPELGKAPYQTFHDMFKLRDMLVHGKTHRVRGHISYQDWEPGDFPEEPKLEIEQIISESNSNRFIEDMDSMMQDLAEHPNVNGRVPALNISGRISFRTDI